VRQNTGLEKLWTTKKLPDDGRLEIKGLEYNEARHLEMSLVWGVSFPFCTQGEQSWRKRCGFVCLFRRHATLLIPHHFSFSVSFSFLFVLEWTGMGIALSLLWEAILATMVLLGLYA
jgi:hypothetical protein